MACGSELEAGDVFLGDFDGMGRGPITCGNNC